LLPKCMRKRVSKGAPLSTFVWKLIGSPRQHSAMAISTSNSAGTAANEEATKEQSSRQAMDRRPSAVPQTNFHVQDARHTIKLLLSNTERHNTNRRDKERRKEGPTRRTRARERTHARTNERTNERMLSRAHTQTRTTTTNKRTNLNNEQTTQLTNAHMQTQTTTNNANANTNTVNKVTEVEVEVIQERKHQSRSHRTNSFFDFGGWATFILTSFDCE